MFLEVFVSNTVPGANMLLLHPRVRGARVHACTRASVLRADGSGCDVHASTTKRLADVGVHGAVCTFEAIRKKRHDNTRLAGRGAKAPMHVGQRWLNNHTAGARRLWCPPPALHTSSKF